MFGGAQLYMNDKFYNISLLDEYNNVTTDFVTCITENIDGSILIGTTANGIFRLKISKADLENIDKISLKAKQYNVLSHFKFQKGKKIEETDSLPISLMNCGSLCPFFMVKTPWFLVAI